MFIETFVIHTEDPPQTRAVRTALKALNVEMNQVSTELLPEHVSRLLKKGIAEADRSEFTVNEDFMEYIKTKYKQ